MTLEENIKAILECNFVIARDEVIESTTKRIMEQIERQNPLEKIKEEIQGLIDFEESCCGNTTLGYQCLGVVEDRISELKGE